MMPTYARLDRVEFPLFFGDILIPREKLQGFFDSEEVPTAEEVPREKGCEVFHCHRKRSCFRSQP